MQTSESASVVERRKGNKIFENAKKWGLSYAMRKRLLDNAMASYIRAEDLASNTDEYSSASKNHGKAAWNLYCLLKEKQEQQVQLHFYLKEAVKFFCVSYEKGSCKQDEWRDDLLTSLNLCIEEVHDIRQSIYDVDEKYRIFSSFIEIVTVKPVHVELQITLAEILFHDAIKLLQDKDYKGALKRLKDCYRPIEEAKRLNDAESCATEIRVIEQDVYFHTCSAESIQACECGNELLNIAILDDESINIDLVWDAIDWYKRAAILTRELDLEQEAIALSHLGYVYNKVLKIKDKSKEYYKKCFELAESMKPRTFLTIDWYQQCVSTLQEFQLQERLEDEKVEEEKREIKLEAIREELEDLGKNNIGNCKILAHVYNTYPPKNPKWEKPSEEDMAKWYKLGNEDLKKILKNGICDYHPDKIDVEKHDYDQTVANIRMDNSPRRFVSLFEPFRIKSVEKIEITTREERLKYLKEAHYNPFMVKSEHVLIDLLTDSGTGAMSTEQWSAMMLGDEMYAGSSSYNKFEAVVKEIFGYRHVLPTHQGRAAERILFHCTLLPGDIVPNNSHFDTTRANVEAKEAIALNLPCPEAFDPNSDYPFKGDMDLKRLEELLSGDERERVRLVLLTITNNAFGGFPVSMANIKAVSKLCHAYNIPLFFDACRFAENAWFIKTKEEGYEAKTPKEISHEIFSLGDGCTMSAKKNGLSNIGGFLAMNDDEVADRCRTELVISEGFVTYGGLAGRDLEAIAVGFREILEDSYLKYQINFVKNLAEMLKDYGVPVLTPSSGHAVG